LKRNHAKQALVTKISGLSSLKKSTRAWEKRKPGGATHKRGKKLQNIRKKSGAKEHTDQARKKNSTAIGGLQERQQKTWRGKGKCANEIRKLVRDAIVNTGSQKATKHERKSGRGGEKQSEGVGKSKTGTKKKTTGVGVLKKKGEGGGSVT